MQQYTQLMQHNHKIDIKNVDKNEETRYIF